MSPMDDDTSIAVSGDLEHIPLRRELMEGERYHTTDGSSYENHEDARASFERQNDENKGICEQCICATCCLGYPLIDNSEPCFWIMCLMGCVGLVYAGVETWWFFLLFSAIAIVASFIAGWRVRKLGVAKQLMESVTEFKHQNDILTAEIDELHTNNRNLTNEVLHFTHVNEKMSIEVKVLNRENQNFHKLNGLLKENVGDVEATKKQLFALLGKYEKENEKFQANNLMHLFFLVDRDNNSFLTQVECTQMNQYVLNIYGISMDLDKLDEDKDEKITIKEFVNGLRNKMNAKNISNQDSFSQITL